MPEKVVAIFCSSGENVFALSAEGKVYSWGKDKFFQLGIYNQSVVDEKKRKKRIKKEEDEKKRLEEESKSEIKKKSKKEEEEDTDKKKPVFPPPKPKKKTRCLSKTTFSCRYKWS